MPSARNCCDVPDEYFASLIKCIPDVFMPADEVKKCSKPLTMHVADGFELWTQGSGTVETLLQTVLEDVVSARDFFDKFIGDSAKFTMLDMDSKPWNTHIETSDGELGQWNADFTRKMTFLAYPVPAAIAPMKYVIEIEQTHKYQFVMVDGAEVLQFESFIVVNQSEKSPSGALPYADSFTLRQLWTITPLPAKKSGRTACSVNVIGELNFIGRAPFVATFISKRAFADHREGVKGWLKGATATLLGKTDSCTAITLARPRSYSHHDGASAKSLAFRGKVFNLANTHTLLVALLLSLLTFVASGNISSLSFP